MERGGGFCRVVEGVQRAVCSVQCAVISEQFTVYSVQHTVYSVHCILQCQVSSELCAVCSVQHSLCSLQCSVCSVHGYWNRVSQRGSRTNERSIRYGGEDPYPLTSLIKTIGGEFSDRQRNANHNYAYTRQCPLCALYRVMT